MMKLKYTKSSTNEHFYLRLRLEKKVRHNTLRFACVKRRSHYISDIPIIVGRIKINPLSSENYFENYMQAVADLGLSREAEGGGGGGGGRFSNRPN